MTEERGKISSPTSGEPELSDERPLLSEMSALWLKTLKWQPDERQQDLFQQLYRSVLEGNSRLNLTRITEPTEFWEKHIWDSIAGVVHLERCETASKARAIDIGTGGGFPGLPIAIAFPSLHVTLLDSTRKKTLFLDSAIADLGLTNAVTLTGRAEILGRQSSHVRSYDLATIRAVGTAALCAQYALPFLRSGGMAVLYRGQWTQNDLAELEAVLPDCSGTIAAIERFFSPLSGSVRHCIYLNVGKTAASELKVR